MVITLNERVASGLKKEEIKEISAFFSSNRRCTSEKKMINKKKKNLPSATNKIKNVTISYLLLVVILRGSEALIDILVVSEEQVLQQGHLL